MRNLFQSTILFLFSVAILSAQPMNDDCLGAIELNSGQINLDFTEATYSGECDIDCMLSFNSGNLCAHDLWYTFTFLDSMIVSITNNTSQGPLYFELYSGSCSNLIFELCAGTLGFTRKLPSGNYFLKTSMSSQGSNYMDVDICPDISIDPIEDVYACESYTLPPINGKNLSGNQAYYRFAPVTGTKYLPGDIITTNMTLYAYDNAGLFSACSESQTFAINIETGGLTVTPFYGGEWSNGDTWIFTTPDVCDNVIVNQNKVVWIDPFYTPSAYCKTFEVALGSEFAIFLGGQLQVGTK